MLYLISQILIWMLLSLAAGLMLGWPLWGRRLRRQVDEVKKRSQKAMESLREELAHSKSRLRQMETQCDALRNERLESDRLVMEARSQASLLEGDAGKLRAELDASRLRVQSLTETLAERDTRIRSSEDQVAVLERQLAKARLEFQRREEELEAQSKRKPKRSAPKRMPAGETGRLQILEPRA